MNSPSPNRSEATWIKTGTEPVQRREREKKTGGRRQRRDKGIKDDFNEVYLVSSFRWRYCVQISSLTLLVAADHGVTLVSREVSNGAKPKVVLCPLNRSLLIEDPARKRHPAANHRRLIHRLDRESLINYFRGRDRPHRRGER